MRFFAVLALLLLPLFVPMQAEANFYSQGMKMGTVHCPGSTMDCGDISMESSTVVENANSCIASRISIPEPIMSSFSSSGEYENCVTPGRAFKDANGFNVWAICCMKKNSEGTCDLECTRYTSQK